MSIASDTRYRSVALSFVNNNQDGSEFVQLLAKPSGAAWAAQRTFPVSSGIDQETTWDTALPLYAYDIALRYLQGSVPAVGYESSDPDAWTASTAAGSKGTVTTSCAGATGLAGVYSSSTELLRLTWSCDQQNVPFLVEKSANGVSGWSTVVADLVATTYDWAPGADLNTTKYFRVTPKRGSVTGPVGDAVAIYVGIQVGTPTWISGTWDADTGRVALLWNAASQALQYRLEKTVNGGGAWSTVGVVTGTSYSYQALSSEGGITIGFRLRGINGAVEGSLSTTQNVNTTIFIVASTLSAVSATNPGTNFSATFSSPSGNVVNNIVQISFSSSSGPYTDLAYFGVVGGTYTNNGGLGSRPAGEAFWFRIRAISASYNPSDPATYEDSNVMGGVVT